MRTPLEGSAVAAFRQTLRGEVVVPGDPDYDRARVVWNGMIDRFPAVVARCAGPADVIAAVGFARDQDLVVAVRARGHSVGGFSTCDGGIVIDLSRMRGVRVDPERRVAARTAGRTSASWITRPRRSAWHARSGSSGTPGWPG